MSAFNEEQIIFVPSEKGFYYNITLGNHIMSGMSTSYKTDFDGSLLIITINGADNRIIHHCTREIATKIINHIHNQLVKK